MTETSNCVKEHTTIGFTKYREGWQLNFVISVKRRMGPGRRWVRLWWTDNNTHTHTHSQSDTQTDRQIDRQTHRHTDTQTHRKTITETQTQRHTGNRLEANVALRAETVSFT